MGVSNKILVNLFLAKGCSKKDEEVETSWSPINFMIYSDIFYDMVNDFISEWIEENEMEEGVNY